MFKGDQSVPEGFTNSDQEIPLDDGEGDDLGNAIGLPDESVDGPRNS